MPNEKGEELWEITQPNIKIIINGLLDPQSNHLHTINKTSFPSYKRQKTSIKIILLRWVYKAHVGNDNDFPKNDWTKSFCCTKKHNMKLQRFVQVNIQVNPICTRRRFKEQVRNILINILNTQDNNMNQVAYSSFATWPWYLASLRVATKRKIYVFVMLLNSLTI